MLVFGNQGGHPQSDTRLILCGQNFRLADGTYQNPNESTPAIKPIFAIFWDFDGVGQVIPTKAYFRKVWI